MKHGRFGIAVDENGLYFCVQYSELLRNGKEVELDNPIQWRGTTANSPQLSRQILEDFLKSLETIETFEL